jgi:PAS domain S-box-containing protein
MEGRKIKILAIDDNQDNLISIKALIRESFPDALVLTALTGLKGIELAIAEDPDVILLDIVMPVMDGFEVCRSVKADKNLCDIPVVFVTAIKGDKQSRIRALDCGAEAFLAKPIDESELTAQIRAMVKIKAASIEKHDEKRRLEELVAERTFELYKNHTETLLLLSDLQKENLARKKSEETTRISEERYRAVAQSAKDAIITINTKGIVQEWNGGAEKIFGYSAAEMIGNELSKIIPKDIVTPHTSGTLSTGEEGGRPEINKTLELLGLHKAGIRFPIEISLAEWETSSGKFFTGIVRDITGRKKIEEDLKESERFLKETQRIANLGTYTFNITANQWESSEILDRIFGIEADADKSMEGWVSIIHPEWQQIMKDYFLNEVVGNRINFNKEYKIIRKSDQVERWVHGLGSLKYNDENQPIILVGAIQDITWRKKAEEEIILAKERAEENERKYRLSETELKRAQSIAHLGNWQWSLSEDKVTWSDEMYQIFGISRETFTGRLGNAIKNAIHPDDLHLVLPKNASEFAARKPVEYRIILPDKSIRHIWAEAGETVFDEQGNPVFLTGIAQDITDRKLIEQDLIVSKERAEEGDRLKTAFLANMSHEIRTPMNGILGFASLLKEQKLTGEEQQEYIAIIEKSGVRMLNIINDIVDISKIESGQMNVYISKTNINEQIGFTYNFFRYEAEQKGLQLLFTKSLPASEAIILTDREKVYAILTNLVKNAIKFTPTGVIEFGYHLSNAVLTFYVKDTGIGIPADRQQAVFDRFIQADIGDKRAFQGAGLGLSISKAYVQMLGGKIWVESEEGKGSTFYFTLPYECESQKYDSVNEMIYGEQAKNEINPDGSGLKILIAEDDDISAKLVALEVKRYEKEILKVSTGVEAVKACRINPDIDLVLMDIKMPEMDGHEATRMIRQFNKEVVIIAQTAYALIGDREKALESGCNDYIAKPFDRVILTTMFEKYFKNRIK